MSRRNFRRFLKGKGIRKLFGENERRYYKLGEGKKRTLQHIKGENGVDILKKFFPEEWVIREYIPDYGIDLSVELFTPYDTGFITSGEHIFFQVKATERIKQARLDIKNGSESVQKVDVIKFVLDTDLLFTVEKMGNAVPVILTVVDIGKEDIYFLCLNDYIEKVLIPADPNYMEKESKTVYIPIENRLNNMGIDIIKWYAKRAKLYAFFNKINEQSRNLKYCSSYELEEKAKNYLNIILRNDVWRACDYFPALKNVKDEIDYYLKNGITKFAEDAIKSRIKVGMNVDEEIWELEDSSCLVSLRKSISLQGIRNIWGQLENLADLFEDVIREYFLPTYINTIT